MGNTNSRRSHRREFTSREIGSSFSSVRKTPQETSNWDDRAIDNLILQRKLAPKAKGTEDERHLTDECPICFLFFDHLNKVKCCNHLICTDCFLQVRKLQSCPFCANQNFAVEYIHQTSSKDDSSSCATPDRKAHDTNHKLSSMSSPTIGSSQNQQQSNNQISSASISIRTPNNTNQASPSQSNSSTPPMAISPVLATSVEARRQLEQEVLTQRINQSSYFAYPVPKPATRTYTRNGLRYRAESMHTSSATSGAMGTGSIIDAFRARRSYSTADGNHSLVMESSNETEDPNPNPNNNHEEDDIYGLGVDIQSYRRLRDRSREARLARELGVTFGYDRERELAQIEEIMLSEAIRLSMAESESSSARIDGAQADSIEQQPSAITAAATSATGSGVGGGAAGTGRGTENQGLAAAAAAMNDSFAIDVSSPLSNSTDTLDMELISTGNNNTTTNNNNSTNQQQVVHNTLGGLGQGQVESSSFGGLSPYGANELIQTSQGLGIPIFLDEAQTKLARERLREMGFGEGEEDRELLLAVALSLQEQNKQVTGTNTSKIKNNSSNNNNSYDTKSSRDVKNDPRPSKEMKISSSTSSSPSTLRDEDFRSISPPIVMFPPDYKFEDDEDKEFVEEVRRANKYMSKIDSMRSKGYVHDVSVVKNSGDGLMISNNNNVSSNSKNVNTVHSEGVKVKVGLVDDEDDEAEDYFTKRRVNNTSNKVLGNRTDDDRGFKSPSSTGSTNSTSTPTSGGRWSSHSLMEKIEKALTPSSSSSSGQSTMGSTRTTTGSSSHFLPISSMFHSSSMKAQSPVVSPPPERVAASNSERNETRKTNEFVPNGKQAEDEIAGDTTLMNALLKSLGERKEDGSSGAGAGAGNLNRSMQTSDRDGKQINQSFTKSR